MRVLKKNLIIISGTGPQIFLDQASKGFDMHFLPENKTESWTRLEYLKSYFVNRVNFESGKSGKKRKTDEVPEKKIIIP